MCSTEQNLIHYNKLFNERIHCYSEFRMLIVGEKVFKSTSINFGFKPDCTIGHKDVDQQRAGIRHSSPFLSLFFFIGFTKAKKAKRFAEDPELTIKQCLELIKFENFFSNSIVFLDIVSLRLFTTFIAVLMSSFENAFSKRGYLNDIFDTLIPITKLILKK